VFSSAMLVRVFGVRGDNIRLERERILAGMHFNLWTINLSVIPVMFSIS